MNVKRLVKLLTPPIIVEAYRWLAAKKDQTPAAGSAKKFLWEGIYRHYGDVSAAGDGYEGQVWIDSRTEATRNLFAGAKNFGAIPPVIESRYNLLAFLAAILSGRSQRVRIIDFGGAMGIAYVYLCSSMTHCDAVDYYLVDNSVSCEQAAKIFADDSRIQFHSGLNHDIPEVDIVFMSGVLQYISDYADAVRRLVQYKPSHILITLIPIVGTPTFASAQVNLEGSVLPAWFFKLTDIVEIMKHHGYSLLFTGSAEPQFDMGNFPEAHRMTHMANLLFSNGPQPQTLRGLRGREQSGVH